MLKRLHLKNFTVFADANFEFGPGLNVLVGTNGTGKSHVLKVGYAVESARSFIEEAREYHGGSANYENWNGIMHHRLLGLFFEGMNYLVSFRSNKVLSIEAELGTNADESTIFEVHPNYGFQDTRAFIKNKFDKLEIESPIFIPTKDILTLGWMLQLMAQPGVAMGFDYIDSLNKLSLPPLPDCQYSKIVNTLISITGGEIDGDRDAYFLVNISGIRVSANMMAEGLRKFAVLQRLLINGSLTKNTTLYWDEPEANLNPALLRKLAAILAELARQGFQIILATHSMSLLKEFHILSREKDAKPLPIKYFGLNAGPGEATRVVTTDNFEYLPDVVALAEELKQADELEDVFIRDDQAYHAQHQGNE